MRIPTSIAAALAALLFAGCSWVPLTPVETEPEDEIGLPVLSLRWRFQVADKTRVTKPQEFSSPALSTGAHSGVDTLFLGSHEGTFFALSMESGRILWERALGSVSSQPAVHEGEVYVGTDDGSLVCLDAGDGSVKWRYATRGPIMHPPVLAGDQVLFANEADHVYALDAQTGKFRWQYKTETPEEFTLRGHAGVAVAGDLAYTGFADGTMVALRVGSGTVAWIKSLKGDADRFIDVDATPLVLGDTVYASSSSGGVYALDRTTGLIRWRLPLDGAGQIGTDGERLYVGAADEGIFALDLSGHVIWRQGTSGGGETAGPVVSGSYLLYALSEDGLFIADKRTGRVHQYFDPGFGISSPPTVVGDEMYVLSNSAVLYAMRLKRFDQAR